MNTFEKICVALTPFVTPQNSGQAIMASYILFAFAGILTVVIICLIARDRRQKALSQQSEASQNHKGSQAGFTLVELIIVIAVIGILASLVLSVAGFIQYKGAVSRAEAEIAALSAALESYKADHGEYPTGSVNPASTSVNSILVAALMPLDEDANGKKIVPPPKVYFEFNKNMLLTNGKTTNAVDPFGEPYGYQYPGNASRSGTNFFDLWTRANGKDDTNKWRRNW